MINIIKRWLFPKGCLIYATLEFHRCPSIHATLESLRSPCCDIMHHYPWHLPHLPETNLVFITFILGFVASCHVFARWRFSVLRFYVKSIAGHLGCFHPSSAPKSNGLPWASSFRWRLCWGGKPILRPKYHQISDFQLVCKSHKHITVISHEYITLFHE